MTAKNSIISVVDNDLSDVVSNAALGRSLVKISAETNLLINTFTRQEVFLAADRKKIIEELKRIDTSQSITKSDHFLKSFQSYASNIEKTLALCERLDNKFQNIKSLDDAIEQQLLALKTILSDQEIILMAEGGGKYHVENLRNMLPTYLQYSLWISDRIYRLNQAYVSMEAIKDEDKQNILKILDDFDSELIELSISGSVFSEIGRQLRAAINSYQKNFLEYHALLEEFQPLLASMNRSQQDILGLSAKIDEKVRAKSEMTKNRISESITSLTIISTTIFILFNTLSAALCFYIIKMFKISRLAQDLQKAIDEISILRGILPICSFCKKIRDDKGYWNQIEEYIVEHSEADFSHSICPECARKHYPDIKIYDDELERHENLITMINHDRSSMKKNGAD